MTKVFLVALVVLVVLTGIPLVAGIPMADCAECDVGAVAAGACLFAFLAAAAAFAVQLGSRLRRRRFSFLARLVDSRLERPPRLA